MNSINSQTPITTVKYEDRNDGLYVVAKAGDTWFTACVKRYNVIDRDYTLYHRKEVQECMET